MTTTEDEAWVPEACSLPTVERPLRLAEFEELFTAALRAQQRLSATTLRWHLDPTAETTARELTIRESSCCSFFTFTFHPGGETLQLDIAVPVTHAEVLDAFAQRAAAGISS